MVTVDVGSDQASTRITGAEAPSTSNRSCLSPYSICGQASTSTRIDRPGSVMLLSHTSCGASGSGTARATPWLGAPIMPEASTG
ncbi:hypothetical protein SRIMM317S_03969 [Streptomyces rimosus subsp. rimosus]